MIVNVTHNKIASSSFSSWHGMTEINSSLYHHHHHLVLKHMKYRCSAKSRGNKTSYKFCSLDFWRRNDCLLVSLYVIQQKVWNSMFVVRLESRKQRIILKRIRLTDSI